LGVITHHWVVAENRGMTAHFINLIDELRRRSLRMASQVEDMLQEACEVLSMPSEQIVRRLIARDDEVDGEEVAVEAEVIRLMALYQPVGADLRFLCAVLKVNSDLERIADCVVNIAERAMNNGLSALARNSAELKQMCPLVRRVLRNAVHAYNTEDAEAAKLVLREDSAIDVLYDEVSRQVVAGAAADPQNVGAQLDLLTVAKTLERVADHATNIAEDVIYLATGAIVRHKSDET
jgi:phosphate transport system protein